jgi:hypothetical protein
MLIGGRAGTVDEAYQPDTLTGVKINLGWGEQMTIILGTMFLVAVALIIRAMLNAPAWTTAEYVVGDFSIADAALFYVEFWADRSKATLPSNCAAHYARMKARPSVQKAMMDEGIG